MMRGLWNLTWLEIKVFVREPLGVVGTVVVPVGVFLLFGEMMSDRADSQTSRVAQYMSVDVPVLAALLIAISAVLSLVTIVAIYRESGILKRLRATPLRPATIFTAHVLVKVLFTIITLGLMAVAGRQYYPVDLEVPWFSFGAALALSTVSILSFGFVLASLVPTARFAQPIGTIVLYPMLGIAGLFVPLSSLPPAFYWLAHTLPTTYGASLMKGILQGESWLAHLGDVTGLVVLFVVFTAVSSRVFRWT